jgi:uncharacterized protein (DUF983 family)
VAAPPILPAAYRDVVNVPTGAAPRPSLATMLWRGARRRCPSCGGRGAFFTGWFAKQDRCRTCGLGWQRGYEGFELGAMAINLVVVFGALIVGLIVGVALTVPDIPVVPMVVVLGAVAVILPIAVYPVSYTVWQAVDLAMHPPEAGDYPTVPPPR